MVKEVRIKAEVTGLLEERGIRIDDVREVLEFAEETKNYYVHDLSGRCLAYFRPAHVTYWVEYGMEEGLRTVHRAYSHRMEILEGFNMAGKERGVVEWTCANCSTRLEHATVKLRYLDETFEARLPACPVCQRVFVSEEDATEKMARAEKMLEDK